MNLIESVETVLYKKYATFKGRAVRSEFWWFELFSVLVFGSFHFWASVSDFPNQVELLMAVCDTLLLVPSISVATRRLHDINRSGWWLLLGLTIVGNLLLLYWFCIRSQAEDNRFGCNPLGEKVPIS